MGRLLGATLVKLGLVPGIALCRDTWCGWLLGATLVGLLVVRAIALRHAA
jgi:hypothetical protein